jgi:OmpA-OmpF porin, OOP family
VRTRTEASLLSIGLVTAAAVVAYAANAQADEPRLHLTAGVAHAVGDPQQSEFGAGGGGTLAGEIPTGKVLGVELEVSALALTAGSAPGARVASPDIGFGLGGMLGLRVRPFGASAPAGLFADAHGGVVYTGDVARPGFDAQIGYDCRVRGTRWDVGPFLGFTEILETSRSIVPGAAQVFLVGAHIALGAREPVRAPPPPAEREAVRIVDPCAVASAVGCPLSDRDHDGVLDADDACADVPGRPTADETTNGCPRADRDNDLVFDDEDACPDVPGVRTADERTNGCPAPRNRVSVQGSLIMLGDIIHFDVDSPRVRHKSWTIVQNVAEFLKANPDITEIDIEGHADEVGPDDYNLALSRARAAAVKQLLAKYGVATDRLTLHAYGESQPRAKGHTEDAFRQNRRVQFVVIRSRPRSDDELVTTVPDSTKSALNMGDPR